MRAARELPLSLSLSIFTLVGGLLSEIGRAKERVPWMKLETTTFVYVPDIG